MAQPEGDLWVSVGTICARKNTVLLAIYAKKAKVPVVFVGKPFSEDDAGCIAVYEAAAATLPLLLSRLPWAARGYHESDCLHLCRFAQLSGSPAG